MTVNITANEGAAARNAIIEKLQQFALYGVAGALVLLIVLSSHIEAFFNLSSAFPLVVLALMLPISALITFRNGFLQGVGKFGTVVRGGMITSGGRLLLSVLLVALSASVLGVFAAMVLAPALTLLLLWSQTRTALARDVSGDQHVLERGSVRKELSYGVLVLFATGMVAVLYTADVLIAKHYFSAHDAGLYSGISAIAKIIFFAVGPVATVLLSSVKFKNTARENARLLQKALGVAVLVGGAGLCTFFVFRDLVVEILIGTRYLELSPLLPLAGLVMFLAALANVLVFYFLALRRFFLIYLSVATLVAFAALVAGSHQSISAILIDLLYGLAALISILLLVYAKDHFSSSSRS